MGRKDEVKKLLADRRADLMKKRLDPLQPIDKWKTIRDEVIKPNLIDTQNGLRESGIGAQEQIKNGGSGITLLVGPPNAAHYLDITFRFVAGDSTIHVSSSEEGIGGVWDDLDEVSDQRVSEAVDLFLGQVANKYFS